MTEKKVYRPSGTSDIQYARLCKAREYLASKPSALMTEEERASDPLFTEEQRKAMNPMFTADGRAVSNGRVFGPCY